MLFCAKNYKNPAGLDDVEFVEDVRRIKYIKKIFSKFHSTGEIKIRLILTHLTVLANVFGKEPLCRIVWLKFDNLSEIKPFLIALNLLDIRIGPVNGKMHDPDEISLDEEIIEKLREIKVRGHE